MSSAVSAGLRDRVIAALEGEMSSCRRAAARFGFSAASAFFLAHIGLKTGRRAVRAARRRKSLGADRMARRPVSGLGRAQERHRVVGTPPGSAQSDHGDKPLETVAVFVRRRITLKRRIRTNRAAPNFSGVVRHGSTEALTA
jgi:hypothetical protein